MGHARLSGDEIESRGTNRYQQVRVEIEIEANMGKICAIDVETGEYFIANKVLDAAEPLHEKHPGAAVWVLQIGSETVDELSGAMNFELLDSWTVWDRTSMTAWQWTDELEQKDTQRKS